MLHQLHRCCRCCCSCCCRRRIFSHRRQCSGCCCRCCHCRFVHFVTGAGAAATVLAAVIVVVCTILVASVACALAAMVGAVCGCICGFAGERAATEQTGGGGNRAKITTPGVGGVTLRRAGYHWGPRPRQSRNTRTHTNTTTGRIIMYGSIGRTPLCTHTAMSTGS